MFNTPEMIEIKKIDNEFLDKINYEREYLNYKIGLKKNFNLKLMVYLNNKGNIVYLLPWEMNSITAAEIIENKEKNKNNQIDIHNLIDILLEITIESERYFIRISAYNSSLSKELGKIKGRGAKRGEVIKYINEKIINKEIPHEIYKIAA